MQSHYTAEATSIATLKPRPVIRHRISSEELLAIFKSSKRNRGKSIGRLRNILIRLLIARRNGWWRHRRARLAFGSRWLRTGRIAAVIAAVFHDPLVRRNFARHLVLIELFDRADLRAIRRRPDRIQRLFP